MPTIIDSLVVTLGLDSKDVDAKAPGVRRKLADLETSAKGTEKGFTGLSGAVESFGAVLASIVSVGVVTAFAKDIIETNTHLYYLSQNLGISAQKLSAWGQMAKQLGGSSASIQNFFGQIRGMYGQYMMGGTPPLQKLFAMVGINPMAAAMQSPEATMLQLAEKFKKSDTGPNRWKAASFMEAGGLSEDVVNMILQGPAWIKSHQKELTALSPTDRQVKASADLTQRLVVLSTAVNKIGNNLLTDLMPLLHKIEIRLDGILKWMLKHGGTTEAIAGTGVGALGLMGIIGSFKILKPLILGIGTAFTAIGWPILAVIAAIAALSLGIYELHKHWSYFVEKWDKFKVTPAMKEATNEWDRLRAKIENATDAFVKWGIAHNVPAVASAVGGVISGSSGYSTGQSIREKYDLFMAKHALGWGVGKTTKDYREAFLVDYLSRSEGFYDHSKPGQNIPQKSHNPGNIEYGDFARSQGATGYVIAQGGKKIATFPDDKTGFNAMHALLGTK